MDQQLLEEQIFDAVQQHRVMKDMAEFRVGDVPYLNQTYKEVKVLHFNVPVVEGENELSSILSEFVNMLDESRSLDENMPDNHSAALDAVLIDRHATHLKVVAVTNNFPEVILEFHLFYHYLDLEPIGPMIDGDIVIQGAFADPFYGPALVAVECDINLDQVYSEVSYVTPSKMMITPAGSSEEPEDSSAKFLIPISVGEEYRSKPLRLKIFCQKLSDIQYEAETENLEELISDEKRHEYILSGLIVPEIGQTIPEIIAEDEPKAETVGENNEKELQDFHESLVIKNIRIATDYDDVIALQHEGFELTCVHFTPTGLISDHDHTWKFHVLAEFGHQDEPGLEDLRFIKCLKSLGTLPSLPFFEVLHDFDLSKPEDDYSVYLAIKRGLSSKFKKLVMISCEADDDLALEQYVKNVPGVFALAPPEIDKANSGHCGLLLLPESTIPDVTTIERELVDVPSTPQLNRRQSMSKKLRAEMGDEPTSPASDEDEDEEEDDDMYLDEEETIRRLQEQLSEYEQEKKQLLQTNAELQKKSVALMAREKALQGQPNPSTASTRPPPSEGNPGGTTNETGEAMNQPLEQNLEKEKQYQDVLALIVEERKKLNKQLKEFDQLALDLQTRLDDKEFKAKTIATSFKQFKKEILQKAENSRTGHPISKPQIQQIEHSEAKHEEDLEKIRLRNISLKTLQKKLERTLRQREQLAEGLHMIDFEQLKIENQTLNEKIEERNEELSKLKRKKTLTVQILTHIREKLRYVEMSNKTLQTKVNAVEGYITGKRNSVTVKKLERDELRNENKEFKAKQGFATSDLLLLDYEKRKYQTQEVHANIMELKNRYDLLSKQLQFTGSSSNFFSSSLSAGGGGGSGGGSKIGNTGLQSVTPPLGMSLPSRGLQSNGNTKAGIFDAVKATKSAK